MTAIHSLYDVWVEVINHHENATAGHDGPFMPDERKYESAEILDSGWIKCVGPRDDRGAEDGQVCVDYFPPECIAGVYSVEDRKS